MAGGIPPRQEGLVSFPAAPLAFLPGAGGDATGICHHPCPLRLLFVSDCPITDSDMTSYADDFTLLASAPSIAEAKARANRICSTLVRWANGKQLAIASWHCSPRIPTSPGSTHKCISVTRWPRCVQHISRLLNVIKALAGSTWGFTTETLVATYKAFVSPILNYAANIWFTQLFSSHLDKLEMIQNKAQRITTGCPLKAAVSPFRAETGVIPLRAHLEHCS